MIECDLEMYITVLHILQESQSINDRLVSLLEDGNVEQVGGPFIIV